MAQIKIDQFFLRQTLQTTIHSLMDSGTYPRWRGVANHAQMVFGSLVPWLDPNGDLYAGTLLGFFDANMTVQAGRTLNVTPTP